MIFVEVLKSAHKNLGGESKRAVLVVLRGVILSWGWHVDWILFACIANLAVSFVLTGQIIFVFTNKIFSEVKTIKYLNCGSCR